MLKKFKATAVVIVIIITVTVEALLALLSESLAYAGTPINDSLEPLLAWALIALGLVAVVTTVGPKHERIWLVALLFLIVTAAGSFFASQLVLSVYKYRRDYTSLTIDADPPLTSLRRGQLNF